MGRFKWILAHWRIKFLVFIAKTFDVFIITNQKGGEIMTLPGETLATGAPRTCPDCGQTVSVKVCHSAGRNEEAAHWQQAAAEKRIKTRKKQGGISVWIEEKGKEEGK
jgi:hypothetical protein